MAQIWPNESLTLSVAVTLHACVTSNNKEGIWRGFKTWYSCGICIWDKVEDCGDQPHWDPYRISLPLIRLCLPSSPLIIVLIESLYNLLPMTERRTLQITKRKSVCDKMADPFWTANSEILLRWTTRHFAPSGDPLRTAISFFGLFFLCFPGILLVQAIQSVTKLT